MIIGKGPCPFKMPTMVCICGRRYQPIDREYPERGLAYDMPGLMFVGECRCCAKASLIGPEERV